MEPALMATRLYEASDKAERIFNEIGRSTFAMERQPNGIFAAHFLFLNFDRIFWKFLALKASEFAENYEMYAKDDEIRENARKLLRTATPANQRVFHQFPRLPAELQIMVWEAAAQPPPCKHYLDGHSVTRGCNSHYTLFTDDAGLWGACHDSRKAMLNVYEKARKNMVDCSVPPSSLFKQTCVRLARIEGDSRHLEDMVVALDAYIKAHFKPSTTPFLRNVFDELYESYPHFEISNKGRLICTGGVLCKELRVEYLFGRHA